MPCCHIPTPARPVFPATLVPDAQCFSQYVGDGNPTGRAATTTILTSGLHLEMKLWPASGGLPLNKYIPNNARNNSWRAMQIRGCNNTFTPTEQNQLFNELLAGLPIPSSRVCCLGDYDGWLLDNVIGFRAAGLQPGRNPVAAVANGSTPTTLASVGLAQKPINVFVKYELCWQVAGQWLRGIFHPYAPLQIPDLPQFVCALHAPVDAILVEKLLALPVGLHLKRQGLLKSRKGSPLIQQSSDGNFRPWSKLDCLRTYYGLQLMLRRIAMATWPKGCACSASPDQAIKDCADWFNEKYRTSNICKGKDWIQAACDLGKEVDVIDKTLAVLRGASTSADATQQGSKATECPSEAGSKKTQMSKTMHPTPPAPPPMAAAAAPAPTGEDSLPGRVARAHAAAYQLGRRLPGASPNVRPTHPGQPVRVHCERLNGVDWQYAFHQTMIHAEAFFPAQNIARYDDLRRDLEVANHDFGEVILGNGAKNGDTRSIKLTIPHGLNTPQNQWAGIANQAVTAMVTLFARIS